MVERVEHFIKYLMAARDIRRLYSDAHPEFRDCVTKAFIQLENILNETAELIIGIVGDEFVFGNEIYFDLSKRLQLVIAYLKERGIERLVFYKGITQEELTAFISFLMLPVENKIDDIDHYLANQGITNIMSGHIKISDPQSKKKIIVPKAFLQQYENSLGAVSHSIENVLDDQTLDYHNLKLTISNVMMNLLGQYQEFLKLGTVKRYDQITFMHMLNVTILSMLFASQLEFENDAVMDIGIAALFHDIGKLYVSRKILSKPGKLEDEEFLAIESHTKLGAEIMLEHAGALGTLPVVVAYEHHIKYNLKGYPKIPSYYKPHVASRLVAICDVYDALTQRRSYKTNYPPETVYNIMIRGREEAFDPELFDSFFSFMGKWPIGTIVKLSNNHIAIVREENAHDIVNPKIEIVHPERTNEILDLREHADTLSIVQSLNPHEEGKQFVDLI